MPAPVLFAPWGRNSPLDSHNGVDNDVDDDNDQEGHDEDDDADECVYRRFRK